MPRSSNITLVPENTSVRLADLELDHPVLACDCYVEGIEDVGESVEWGWRYRQSENIDHHAPVPRMARNVSSANLALARVRALGPVDSGSEVLLTHTDCDSVLTAGIVTGCLDPDERYGHAAIAADHTGEANEIADLLQSIQRIRDVEQSLAVLRQLERGDPLPSWARDELENRQRLREEAAKSVAAGRFAVTGGIWWAEFDHEIDGECFPALLPEAELIVMGYPHPTQADRWAIKVRRGQAMAAGQTLDDLHLTEMDPAYGGRWNAGSNKRGGGTMSRVEEWAEAFR